ncbi:unnamed protein product [Arabidopsis halleri]
MYDSIISLGVLSHIIFVISFKLDKIRNQLDNFFRC